MRVESRKPPKRFGGGHRRGLEEARAELTERPGQRLLHQEHRHKIEQERHQHFVHPPAEMNRGRKGRPQRAQGRSAGQGGRDRQPPNSRPVRSSAVAVMQTHLVKVRKTQEVRLLTSDPLTRSDFNAS